MFRDSFDDGKQQVILIAQGDNRTGDITAFADATGGKVTVTTTNTLADGDSVVITGTTSYNGTFTIESTTSSSFVITDTWVANDAVGTWAINAGGGNIYHYQYPANYFSMTLPQTLIATDKVRFVQALNYTYIFRGDERDVWRWDGGETNAIEVLPIPTISYLKMVGARTGAYIFNRLWLISGVSTLTPADILEETVDYVNNSIDIAQGDGEKLIAVHKFGERSIIAFKEKSTAIITGGDGTIVNASVDLDVDFIDTTFGCVSEDTIVQVGVDLWWLSSQGVVSVGDTEFNKTQLIQVPLSEPISELMSRINYSRDVIARASAVLYDNYYILAVPIDGAEYPNAMFVYDFLLKQWIGMWRMRNSSGALDDGNNDPIYRHRRLIPWENTGDQRIASIGYEGEFLQLLTSRFDDDFENNGGYYVSMDSTDEIAFADVAVETAIESQTKGIIELKFRINTIPTGSAGQLINVETSTVDFMLITINTSGGLSGILRASGTKWQFASSEVIATGVWHTFTILHDGTEPSMYIDTKLWPITFSVTTDKTQWFNNMGGTFDIIDLDATNSLAYDIEYISFQDYTGTPSTSGRAAVLAHFPLNEGTGTTVTASNDTDITGTFVGSPAWSSPTAPADIHTKVKTRDFFADSPSDKLITQGEISFVQADPKVTVTLITPGGYDDETEFTDRTYDETAYDIDGHITYVTSNTNSDHDDEGRKNYMPITMPVAGVNNPVAGITVNREVERTENIFGNIVVQRCGIEIANTQGHMAIKDIVLSYNDKGIGKRRSLG